MNWEYIIAFLIVFVIIPLAGMGFNWLRLKAKDTKWAAFADNIFVLVNAAEEMYIKGELDNRLSYVTTHIQRWLDSVNLKIDVGLVQAYIKNAVACLPPTTPRLLK